MATLSTARIAELLQPFYPLPAALLLDQLSLYLDLLVKWNARTNLTAIREPEEMVQRHFGESLFVARHLPAAGTLLDLGSGAGFPGVPIQLVRPDLRITLAESQNKKASFLQEVVRQLHLDSEVFGARAETLIPTRKFDIVTLRAVDSPDRAILIANQLVRSGGLIAHLTSGDPVGGSVLPLPLTPNLKLHLVTT